MSDKRERRVGAWAKGGKNAPISPTQFNMWKHDPERYYLQYLAENRMPREPQNMAMALGSGVDAILKGTLAKDLGLEEKDGLLSIPRLWEKDVSDEWRVSIRGDVGRVVKEYKVCGAYGRLLGLLRRALDTGGWVKMDFSSNTCVQDTWFNMKPDVAYCICDEHVGDVVVIDDWKVTGHTSKWTKSPTQGYFWCGDVKGKVKEHKLFVRESVSGIAVDGSRTMFSKNERWRVQLNFYSWMFECENMVLGIQEVMPERTAIHRVSRDRGEGDELFIEVQAFLEVINSDWYFRSMSQEKSERKCSLLERRFETFKSDDPFMKWYRDNV